MSELLQKIAFVYAIKRSLKTQAPSSFRYDPSNNFTVTVIKLPTTGKEILVDGINTQNITGRGWNGTEFDEIETVSLNELGEAQFEATRFFGFVQTKYHSLSDYLWGELTALPRRGHLKERFRQIAYNSTTRFRHDRISVLNSIVDAHLERAENDKGLLSKIQDAGVVQLMSDVYGNRVFAHPSFSKEAARFRLILGSLAKTGELDEMGKQSFSLNPKALATIAEYEQAERRHNDSVIHNRRLFWLTVILAIAAVAQSISSYFQFIE